MEHWAIKRVNILICVDTFQLFTAFAKNNGKR